jgi:cyclophilin family peptidyl-prolyl cis-trans isomerase
VAEVVTNKGSFTIELAADTSPGNVNNFIALARYGYYEGARCHRVITDFVVQCGLVDDDESKPGYNVPDELPGADAYAEGVVAVANTGQPDSGGGQWFIITGENGASLPPSYSVLGKVTLGYDSTVRALENLADPTAANGVPPLDEIIIESITITAA